MQAYLKVGATCKHAYGYSLEGTLDPTVVDRHHFDANITPADFADTYGPPFERCVKEGKPGSMMCSYNAVSGHAETSWVAGLRSCLPTPWEQHNENEVKQRNKTNSHDPAAARR